MQRRRKGTTNERRARLNHSSPFSRYLLLLLLLTSVSACVFQNALTSGPQPARNQITTEDAKLSHLLSRYRHDWLALEPLDASYQGINVFDNEFQPPETKAYRNKRLAFERDWLNRLRKIDRNKLSADFALSWKVFEYDRLMAIEEMQYPAYMMPINQMYGLHNFFAELGAGKSMHPFRTETDYKNFMRRAEGFARWSQQAISNMREGIHNKIVLPKDIVIKIIPQLKAHCQKDIEKSAFVKPLKTLPDKMKPAKKEQLRRSYQAMIGQVIIPTYCRLERFMRNEYLPHARRNWGLRELRDGNKWYRFLIRKNTTLELSPEEIHQYGLSEVSRIIGEMNVVKKQIGFQGDLKSFFSFVRDNPHYYFNSKDELVNAYRAVKAKISTSLPRLFSVLPRADYEVRLVSEFRAASSPGAFYNGPSADGTRPGIFYINGFNLKSQPRFLAETLSLHEAAPGHHFQISLQQESPLLPDYRKFQSYSAFAEGWALYAESLGKELGLFEDPMMWYGRLSDEQLRAMRLVVDTGIHALGWSREKAIRWMLAHSSMAKSDIEAEVERYIVMPAQALAYKIGERTFLQLRRKAQDRLKEKFDIKAFHYQILSAGALPLPLLEERMNRWINSQL